MTTNDSQSNGEANLKICGSCRKEKPYAEFYLDKYSRDGHKSHCKSCCKNRDKRRDWTKDEVRENVSRKRRELSAQELHQQGIEWTRLMLKMDWESRPWHRRRLMGVFERRAHGNP